MSVCLNCNKEIEDYDLRFADIHRFAGFLEGPYCGDCFRIWFQVCSECNKDSWAEDMVETIEHVFICKKCSENNH